MATFSVIPDEGWENEKIPKNIEAAFGDGYTQRAGDGINNNPNMFSVSFTREYSIIDTIDTFLNTNKSVSFTWTPPRGTSGKYICKEWTRSNVSAGVDRISGIFLENFI